MVERSVRIASPHGLHARPAAAFVKAAASCGVPVTVGKSDREPVDASSMLGVLTLNAAQGDEVVLRADGERAEEVLDQLVAMLSDPAT